MFFGLVLFFKQKTAYEMRISDWSADVSSSDLYIGDEGPRQRQQPLPPAIAARGEMQAHAEPPEQQRGGEAEQQAQRLAQPGFRPAEQIGRVSCRDRVCQYG